MYDSCGGKLFWLLPPTIYGSFSKKHLFSLDQYAVRIPYPNEKFDKLCKYSDSNGCDLWEEQRGLHFFTVAVQRRAIYEVCDFANFLSDATSAATYAAAATNLDAKLTTFWNANAQSVAESVFRAATAYVKAGSITVTALNQKLFNAGAPVGLGLKAYGDKHIRRFKLHGAADNHFNEQFNRNTGVAQGVNDLTWSYAALISTNNARAELKALSP
ncbi:unnamed protein product [Aphanomyces euteiches]